MSPPTSQSGKVVRPLTGRPTPRALAAVQTMTKPSLSLGPAGRESHVEWRSKMKILLTTALVAAAAFAPNRTAAAQVAGQATVGVTIEEMKLVVLGWSAR